MNSPTEPLKVNVELPPAILAKLIKNNGNALFLTEDEKTVYYIWFCEKIGLEPGTMPLQWVEEKNKDGTVIRVVLYCARAGAAQLNRIYKVSHENKGREMAGTCYCVYTRAILPDGRFEDSVGSVNLTKWGKHLEGDMLSNAMMKADTKSKRRGTLDLLGLGMLDEVELNEEDLLKIENYKAPAAVEERMSPPLAQQQAATPTDNTIGNEPKKEETKETPKKEEKKADAAPTPKEVEIEKARANLKKHNLSEQDAIDLLVNSYKLENVKRIEDFEDTFIEALQTDKFANKVIDAIKKKAEKAAAEKPVKKEEEKTPMTKEEKKDPSIDQEVFVREFATGNPFKEDKTFDWKTVAVHFGDDQGLMVHKMTRGKFNFYYSKWPVDRDHRFTPADYALDAALVIAAREE